MARGRRRSDVAAAVDIGSYSVHLLVAKVSSHALEPVHDESAFLGLGRTIDADGRLGDARATLRDTLAQYRARAGSLGAAAMAVVATDPLRRAADTADVIAEVEDATGLEITVLSHLEEALLALVGVQAGRPVTRDTLMVDVGGGSTEVLVVGPAGDPHAVGLPLGATRLTGVHIHHDPPTSAEIAELRREVATAMDLAPASVPARLEAVGGTARSLLRVGPRLANRVLTERRVLNALDAITSAPAAEIAERYGIRLSRARVLGAGAAILLGALARYDQDRLHVAVGGLREGVILAAHHSGRAWRREIYGLARGWER